MGVCCQTVIYLYIWIYLHETGIAHIYAHSRREASLYHRKALPKPPLRRSNIRPGVDLCEMLTLIARVNSNLADFSTTEESSINPMKLSIALAFSGIFAVEVCQTFSPPQQHSKE